MGNTFSSPLTPQTAKWLAPSAFALDFAAQQYGMLVSSPNMKDVHDANLSFFSPQPFFIAGFFGPQQLVQGWWLWRLWRLEGEVRREGGTKEKKRELREMVDYVPVYALGNLCIAAWMLVWNTNHLGVSHVFVTINTFAQLWYMTTRLPPMNTRSTSSILTHIVAKTFAGIGVLDFLHNGSVAFFKDEAPNLAVKVLTGLGFGLASAASDWIFGGCLVYDLVALAAGQQGEWRNWLSLYALGSAGIVTAKNLARPPYSDGYDLVGQESIEDVV